MKHEHIFEKYLTSAKVIGSINLLCAKDSLSYLSDGERTGCLLLGVEGFILDENGTVQPTQEASNDIAEVSVSAAQFVRDTRDLIQKFPDYWYEVVYESV